jgi:hypothetical protein
LGYSADCARWRLRQRGISNARYDDTVRQHGDASWQHGDSNHAEPDPDDTGPGSRRKLHKPCHPRQQHDAVNSKTECNSRNEHERPMRKSARDARRFQWLSEQPRFSVDLS